jgi:membrane protein involved in colicin uptake
MNDLIIRIILFVISFGLLVYLIYRNKKDTQKISLNSINDGVMVSSEIIKWGKMVDKEFKKRRNNVSKKRKIRTNKTKKTRVGKG